MVRKVEPSLMVKKDGMILENNMIIGRRSINNNNFKATFSIGAEPTFLKQNKVMYD